MVWIKDFPLSTEKFEEVEENYYHHSRRENFQIHYPEAKFALQKQILFFI